MDFIDVTVFSKRESNKPSSDRQKYEHYCLPLNAIRSVLKKLGSDNVYIIYIRDGYEPRGLLFEADSVEAILFPSFVQILNKQGR